MSFKPFDRFVVTDDDKNPLHSDNRVSAAKDWMYGTHDRDQLRNHNRGGRKLFDMRQVADDGHSPVEIDKIDGLPASGV